MRRVVRILWLGLLFGCVHPMSQVEIDRLTTCHNTDLAKIRKSLLLNGYEIKSSNDSDLVTDYKQVSGYDRERTLQRITVVKTGEKSFRYKVRMKYIRIEKENDSGMTVVNRDGRNHPTSAMTFDFSQPVEVTNEGDMDFYEERAGQYEELQHEVCGN